jgi:c-di-GMP-binding flagellar brake protein YcgR
MANDSQSILSDAIARNLSIVLSLPSAGMLRHHKSRLLGFEGEAIWVESARDDRLLIEELVNTKMPVGISFRSGSQKVSFTVPILSLPSQFRMNEQTMVEAIQIGWPENLKAIQRRNSYRVRVPADEEIRLRVWRIAEHFVLRDKPMAAQELLVKLIDLSTGGLGVQILPKNEEPPRACQDERVRITLQYKSMDPLILEGRLRMRHAAQQPDLIRCGVQFKKLENDLEGRQNLAVLTQIVGDLQREEVRRMRLGMKIA